MARYKAFLDVSVVEAALDRIRHVYQTFDSVVVAFSGGKDSLVCLNLVRQVAEERGRLPVDVIFRDEEVIQDEVIAFVDAYRQQPWVRMRWYAFTMRSRKFILGRQLEYTQWDSAREHVRPKPEHAISITVDGDQHDVDHLAAGYLPGKVAIICGIRASESVTRYRSVVNKLNENYICTPVGVSPSSRFKLVKPIYDWEENDVMKWLHESGIPWCQVYDAQHLAGVGLRVSTPLHPESAKRLDRLKEWSPDFYGRVLEAFPEMDVQSRYWHEFDKGKVLALYVADGWAGCRRYIEENIPDRRLRASARKTLATYQMLSHANPAYSPEKLLREVLIAGTSGARFQPTKR